MHPTRPRRSRTKSRTTLGSRAILAVTLLAIITAAAGCGRDREEPAVNLEGVSTTGDNPFTPPVGADQAGVAPPPGAGGTFAGNTVGLYGGTLSSSTCDKAQLAAFLQQDRAKAAAFASVLGIAVTDIQVFVASLTPAILRSDTRVTNHGFRDGRAVEIPAVLQAGTAVLVDVHGAPVTKCFCGNPLTPPKVQKSERFVGPQWSNFQSTEVTVIAPVTQTVQQFVMVEPSSGRSFQRPAGSTGRQDAVAPSPAPSTFGPTTSAPPSTPGTTAGPASPVPPGLAVPTPSVPLPPPSPSLSPTPGTATGSPPARTATGSPSPSPRTTTGSPSPSPTGVTPAPPSPPATPTPSPSPTITPSPPASPTAPPPASPPAGTPSPPPASPPAGTPSPPTTGASPSPSAVVRASWVAGDCYVSGGIAHGRVLVRTDDSAPHRFRVTVRLGTEADPVAVETVRVTTTPGQIGEAEITEQAGGPDGSLQCAVLSIVDEDSGAPPVQGEPLAPPPDSSPMPARPGPGVPSGPPIPSAPPPPVMPGRPS